MRKLNRDPYVMLRVLNKLRTRIHAGQEVTDNAWNVAYDIVHAELSIDTIDWKINNIARG